MKKALISALLTAALSLGSLTALANVGDVIGTAYNTDIVAYINNYAVPSYAVNGQSVIVAEDLSNFGFDVTWDNDTRSLNITRNNVNTPNEMTVSKFEKSGTKFADILETDISVYAAGSLITSYALNGYTMIPFEELTMFGNVDWVESERALKLWIDNLHIREAKQQPEKSKIGAPIGDMLCEEGIGFYTNSVGGVNAFWQGKNNTGKVINYYTANFSMYNAVWDPAIDEFKGTNHVSHKVVGPVPAGADLLIYGVIGYCNVCEYISLDSVYVEYADGTSELIDYGYIGGETLWHKY